MWRDYHNSLEISNHVFVHYKERCDKIGQNTAFSLEFVCRPYMQCHDVGPQNRWEMGS